MPTFDVDATNPAAPLVLVNGREQKGLAHAAVILPAGAVPELHLTFLAGGRFRGDGDVYVVQAGTEAVDAWLADIDPSMLERRALELDERDGPMSPGTMMVAALRSIAQEQAERRGAHAGS